MKAKQHNPASSTLTGRTGVAVCERHDSVCLRVEEPAGASENARYGVQYHPDERAAGRFVDLVWSDDDDPAKTRDACRRRDPRSGYRAGVGVTSRAGAIGPRAH